MSDSTRDIFQKPVYVPDAGEIYPILMKEYDDFMDRANVISYTYEHFNLEEISKVLGMPVEEIKLLDLIGMAAQQSQSFDETFNNLAEMLSFCLRRVVNFKYSKEELFFVSEDEDRLVDRNNYDIVRQVIMKQNLIFTPKVYKDKIVQEWAEKALAVRAQSSVKISNEAVITTIATMTGKHYWDLENYSYYQLNAEFKRIGRFKEYDTLAIAFGNPYADKIDLPHFAESMDMHINPYDDVFKSSDNNKLDKVMG